MKVSLLPVCLLEKGEHQPTIQCAPAPRLRVLNLAPDLEIAAHTHTFPLTADPIADILFSTF